MQNQSPKNWPKNKIGELDAVKHFIENRGEIFYPTKVNVGIEEPIDVQYKSLKFQIVKADFEFQKTLGRAREKGSQYISDRKRNRAQIWEDYIIKPLKKKSIYGKSTIGIILLIHLYVEPPWIEEDLKTVQSLETFINQLKTFGFDEIFLVLPKKNIKIYPGLL